MGPIARALPREPIARGAVNETKRTDLEDETDVAEWAVVVP